MVKRCRKIVFIFSLALLASAGFRRCLLTIRRRRAATALPKWRYFMENGSVITCAAREMLMPNDRGAIKPKISWPFCIDKRYFNAGKFCAEMSLPLPRWSRLVISRHHSSLSRKENGGSSSDEAFMFVERNAASPRQQSSAETIKSWFSDAGEEK